MTNINRTKESIQNILIFFTDAIAIVLSYYQYEEPYWFLS